MATVYVLQNASNSIVLKVVSNGGGNVAISLDDMCARKGFVPGSTLDEMLALPKCEVYAEYDKATRIGSYAVVKQVQWAAGEAGSDNIEICRGGEHYLWCYGGPQGCLYLEGSITPPDNTLMDQDFEFKCKGNCDMYIVIRKCGYDAIIGM